MKPKIISIPYSNFERFIEKAAHAVPIKQAEAPALKNIAGSPPFNTLIIKKIKVTITPIVIIAGSIFSPPKNYNEIILSN